MCRFCRESWTKLETPYSVWCTNRVQWTNWAESIVYRSSVISAQFWGISVVLSVTRVSHPEVRWSSSCLHYLIQLILSLPSLTSSPSSSDLTCFPTKRNIRFQYCGLWGLCGWRKKLLPKVYENLEICGRLWTFMLGIATRIDKSKTALSGLISHDKILNIEVGRIVAGPWFGD